VGALFAIFCLITTLVAFVLWRGWTHRALPLLIGMWAALWATSSYFVNRSYDVAIVSAAPILCLVFGVILLILTHESIERAWDNYLRLAIVPMLTVLLATPLMAQQPLAEYLTGLQTGNQEHFEHTLPMLDSELQALFNAAGVQPDDPLVLLAYSDFLLPARTVTVDGQERFISTTRAWIPITPTHLLIPLRPERSKVYMERYIARRHMSGWLLMKREMPYHLYPWIAEPLAHSYTRTKAFESERYILFWFESTEPAPATR